MSEGYDYNKAIAPETQRVQCPGHSYSILEPICHARQGWGYWGCEKCSLADKFVARVNRKRFRRTWREVRLSHLSLAVQVHHVTGRKKEDQNED